MWKPQNPKTPKPQNPVSDKFVELKYWEILEMESLSVSFDF